MACCSNPLLRQPNSTASFSPRHHPFSPNLQNQLQIYPNLSTTNLRSQLINTTVPRSSYYTPPITTSDSPAKALRQLLESLGIHQGPACFDALSAKLIERAGFGFCFTSGFSISAACLGLPDVGLISYGEMVDQGSLITQAVSIPVIGHGDNGYGNAMNVKRTVKGFIKAGFAGILLEDQVYF